METKTILIPNIMCDGCVRTIRNEIGTISGAQVVEGSVDSKIVTVRWESPASWQQIQEKLNEIEYPPAQS